MTHPQWQVVANAVNPLLVLLLLGVVWRWAAGWQYLARVFLALVLVELCAKAVQHAHWLPGRFPSTHFAFALTMATAVAVLRPRWGWPLAVFLAGYGFLMLFQHYHVLFDLVGALFAVGVTLALCACRAKRGEGP